MGGLLGGEIAGARAGVHGGCVLNIHHLELFYHVARAGGISRAVKRIPYGIQQPAVSGQIGQLERDLGVRLFERAPFRLTRAGEQLFAFAEPFFGGLESIEATLREQSAPTLRIGAAELALRFHLPAVLESLRKREPGLRLCLRSGFQAELESLLLERSIDLAVTPLDRRPPRRFRVLPLLRVPLVLQVPEASKVRCAEELLSPRRNEEPLIALPESESAVRRFRKGLQKRGVAWPTTIEASSLEAITAYVACGAGIGLNVGLAEATRQPRVRALPLDGFEPLEIAVLWVDDANERIREFVAEVQHYVAKVWPASVVKP